MYFIDQEHNIASTSVVNDVDVEYSQDKEISKYLICYNF